MGSTKHRDRLAAPDRPSVGGAVLIFLRDIGKRGLVCGQRRAGEWPSGLRRRRLDWREHRVINMEVFSASHDRHRREWLDWVVGVVRLRVPETAAGLWSLDIDDRELLLNIFVCHLEARSASG